MGWIYDSIFEREYSPKTYPDLSQYWRNEGSNLPVGKMGYRRKTLVAGPRLEVEVYPVFGREEEARARAIKKNITPEKQKRLNNQRAERYFVQLADANFTDKDIEITLTYEKHYQPDFEQCRKDVQNFIRRLREYRKKRGLGNPKYLYTIEGGREKKHGYGVTNFHAHFLMDGQVPRDVIESIWGKGYANTKRLQPSEDTGLEELAKYMIKESKKTGARRGWSQNLTKPCVRSRDVKTSNRVVKAMARDIRNEAKEEMEKRYPSYKFIDCKVFYSDQIDGVYIRVTMRRRSEHGKQTGRSDRGFAGSAHEAKLDGGKRQSGNHVRGRGQDHPFA